MAAYYLCVKDPVSESPEVLYFDRKTFQRFGRGSDWNEVLVFGSVNIKVVQFRVLLWFSVH